MTPTSCTCSRPSQMCWMGSGRALAGERKARPVLGLQDTFAKGRAF
jgi:hypothetical protein